MLSLWILSKPEIRINTPTMGTASRWSPFGRAVQKWEFLCCQILLTSQLPPPIAANLTDQVGLFQPWYMTRPKKESKKYEHSMSWFRSRDLRVMSPCGIVSIDLCGGCIQVNLRRASSEPTCCRYHLSVLLLHIAACQFSCGWILARSLCFPLTALRFPGRFTNEKPPTQSILPPPSTYFKINLLD